MPDRKIDHLLELVPGFRPGAATVTELGGGITNRNYRVDVDGQSYVLRVCDPGTEHLGIRRDHEVACSRIAAALGIGPEVALADVNKGILVTRFLEGETLTAETAREPGRIARIASVVRTYHEGPAFPGTFSPFQTVRDYHRIALEKGVAFPREVDSAFEMMEAIEQATGAHATAAPCHNDLLAGNFIDDGERIHVLDWEYAAMGDPFFDLGNFAVNQELDDSGCETLLAAYSRDRAAVNEIDRARLLLMRLASDLRESFWGFLQSGLSTLDFDYAEYGRKHLTRFLDHASMPPVASALRLFGRDRRAR